MNKKTKIAIYVSSIILALLAVTTGLFWAKTEGFLFKEAAVEELKADVAWYSEGESEFVITTVEELQDIAKLSKYYDFAGQTIKLGADIVFNEGNASDWGEMRPDIKWFPIEGFAGEFDGQGHSISGIYGSAADTPMGLFAKTKSKSKIHDLKILNSYFKVSGDRVGSVSATGTGTFENIYTNAIIETDAKYNGGIIGEIDAAGQSAVLGFKTVISNCWFDGEIHMTGRDGLYGGGIVGRISAGMVNISHCLSSGKITNQSKDRGIHLGGIVGDLYSTNGNVSLQLNDSLSVAKISVAYDNCVGSIIGRGRAGITIGFSDVYASNESYYTTIDLDGATLTNGVVQVPEKELEGYGGYQWTTLDFDKYWVIDKEGTPVLAYFADEKPSLDGVEKGFNTAWYDENANKLVINDLKDFLGIQYLTLGKGITFQGQIIELNTDIKLNDGTASTWRKAAPNRVWNPIGTWKQQFAGVFDGKGHTISGIYLKTASNYAGLFGVTALGSEIRNVRIVNSYFENNSGSVAIMGSVAGRCMGNITNVYSEATLVSNAQFVGGIVGQTWEQEITISNCWFNGNISMEGGYGFYVGGILAENRDKTATIEHCLYTGHISVETPQDNFKGLPHAGGLVGKATSKNATLILKDCLSAGSINNISNRSAVGSVLGRSQYAKVILENVYATKECNPKATLESDIPENIVGMAYVFDEVALTGKGGYEWTTLDFKNYWSIVSNDTPALKTFAKSSLSTVGLSKRIDFSWYDADKTTYILDSKEDLLAFQMLSTANTFEGKTIKLGADIALNQGDASAWETKAPSTQWIPVGTWNKKFSGVFDGQGHTISGIYVKGDGVYSGLFGVTAKGSVIKKLKLTNSYFENTSGNTAVMGSVVGRLLGDIHTVYSDAIIVSNAGFVGGLVGQTWSEPTRIQNSWFNGSITMTGPKGIRVGGILGEQRESEVHIENCLNTGDISVEASATGGLPHAGGIIGQVNAAGAKLYLKDCLNVGKINNISGRGAVASILGRGGEGTSVKVENVYSASESYNIAVQMDNNNDLHGKAMVLPTSQLTGFGGYEWTFLDFDKYWTVVENNTPVLKAFATSIPSLEGYSKMIDTSWYDAEKDVYVLKTVADLYGFYLLSEETTFAGKTIKLGADIVVNEGDASKWGQNAPRYRWTSVGTWNQKFAGTFDGQGYTISGIYQKANNVYMGLFGVTAKGSAVKKLKVTNSYFENTNGDSALMGSIVGRLLGDIHSVYSDAIIVSNAGFVGGLVGQTWSEPTKIQNSWFDGSITMTGPKGIRVGGILGEQRESEVCIENCLNTADISVEASATGGLPHAGGIIGQVNAAGAKLYLKDCLNVGKINNISGRGAVGSILGRGGAETIVKVENVYTTSESYTVDISMDNKDDLQGKASVLPTSQIKGEGGYEWTLLDFDNYWVARENATPELRMFAKGTALDLTNAVRVDTSWYNKNDKVFTITSVNQFLGFTHLAQSNTFVGQTIKLGANITLNEGDASTWRTNAPKKVWTPIGKWTSQFAGTFDGQGYTISGVYLKTNTSYGGLFGVTAEGSLLKNFKLVNSYFENNSGGDAAIMGGIVGRALGNISGVYNSAIIVSNARIVGGFVGQVWTAPISITNSQFAGKIYMEDGNGFYAGGFVGEQRAGGTTMEHCLFNGYVSVETPASNYKGLPRTGGFVGLINTEKFIIKDSFSAGQMVNISNRDTVGSINGQCSNNGKLQLEKVYATTECYNTATNTENSANVSGVTTTFATSELCGTKGYTNTLLDFDTYWVALEGKTPELRKFTIGTALDLSRLSRADITWYTSTEAGKTFVIDHIDEFLGFQKLSDEGKTFAGQTIKLGADITLNEGNASEWQTKAPQLTWSPIGSWTYKFAGTFDGQGYTISGLYSKKTSAYNGVFEVTAAGSVVKNFSLVNSYFEHASNSNGGAIMGSIVGRCMGDVHTVYSNAILVSDSMITGGIVGHSWDNSIKITNCWFDGSITLTGKYGIWAGGILAEVRSAGTTATVASCLNTGKIIASPTTTSVHGVGGIVGFVNQTNAKLVIKDCMNAKTITNENTKKDGVASVLGYAGLNNYAPVIEIKNTFVADDNTKQVDGSTSVQYVSKEITRFTNAMNGTVQTLNLNDSYWVAVPEGTPILKSFQMLPTLMSTRLYMSSNSDELRTMLNVKVQVATDGSNIMRFVSSVDSLDYKKVGFLVSVNGEEPITYETNIVFEKIASVTDSVKYEFSPKVVDTKSEYFITAKLNAIAGKDYTVRAFVKTMDGQYVYGASRCISVEDGQVDTPLNLSFASNASVEVGTELVVEYGKNSTSTKATVIGSDGETIHVRVDVDKENLPSATMFTFNGKTTGTTIYRNLYTSYDGQADTTWYDVYRAIGKTEYVLATDADLYGFSQLSSSKTFANEKIYVIADIKCNEGKADNWRTNKPSYSWTPIGSWNSQFAGTFDGQGHTISGLYFVRNQSYGGMFAVSAEGSLITNFKLTNSYFENNSGGDAAIMGGIVGRARGSISNVYNSAILVSNARIVGGFIGQVWDKPLSITNCQFDGKIYMEDGNGFYAGGFVGEQRAANTTVSHSLFSGYISVETPASNYKGLPHTGGFVGLVNTQTFTLKDVVSAGTIVNISNRNTVGSIIGRCMTNGLAKLDKVYASTECYSVAQYADVVSNISGTTEQFAETELKGLKARQNTWIDFENYWVALEGKTPVLKAFCEEEGLDTDSIKKVDTSWYVATQNATFVLENKDQFYGFQELVDSGKTFATQTVLLGTDMIINAKDGKASTWGEKAPTYTWSPIGSWNNKFAGTFDGQGHTISGLYSKKSSAYNGLFEVTAVGSIVKNFRLENSYFEHASNSNGGAIMGSVVGRCLGDVQSVYSNAILVSDSMITGGIVGHSWENSINITNCWFDGTITMLGQNGIWAGGILGEVREAGTTVTLTACLNTGKITASSTTTSWMCVGGLVGLVNQANAKLVIKDSMNAATLTNENARAGSVASTVGLAGMNNVATVIEIRNTYVADNNERKIDGFTAVQYVSKEIIEFADAMKGTVQTLNANGDYWVAVDGSTPILKSFR